MTTPTPRKRGHVYRRQRLQYLRQHNTCHLCGKPGADTIDHLVPLAKGGSENDPSNWAPAHRVCNSSRGTKAPTPIASPSRDW